ncbi:MAG: hypothetical protein QME40_03040 [bacterium]|nr:hypothetical protein [bacterium]
MYIHHRIWLEKASAGIAKVNRYFRTQEETQVFIIYKDTQEKMKIQQGGGRDAFKGNVKVR